MATGFVDRARLTAILQRSGVDGLLVVQPENFRYVTGTHPGFPSSWRRAFTQMALLPSGTQQTMTLIVPEALDAYFRRACEFAEVRTFPVWTDQVDLVPYLDGDMPTLKMLSNAGRAPDRPRPETYDQDIGLKELGSALRERGLSRSRIGVEFEFIPVADMTALRNAMPDITFVDSSDIFRQLRLIKCEREIELLRIGAELTDFGIGAVIASLETGMTAKDLSATFQTAVLREARRREIQGFESSWTVFSCGGDLCGGASSTSKLNPGDVVKLDCGCTIDGYISDVARTVVFGKDVSNDHARSIYSAVLEAWNAGLDKFAPGVLLREVHEAAQSHMRKAGYTAYTRGHVGHSIGSTVWNEEWPYISAQAETVVQKDMVFAYEVPMFVNGVGAITIEDHIQILDSGVKSMNSLSREYLQV